MSIDKDFGEPVSQPTVVVKAAQSESMLYSEKKDNIREFVSWEKLPENQYRIAGEFFTALPAGFYDILYDNRDGVHFQSLSINFDELIRTHVGVSDTLLKDINIFWQSKSKYKQLGFVHYRGYLLYGRHGTGKSSLVQLICKDVVDRGGIILLCPEEVGMLTDAVKKLRLVEKDRPLVCLFEDIDAIIAHDGESALLSFLDGEQKIDNILNIATTNYPEKLDKRIVARPRRFDRVLKIDFPTREERKAYLQTKIDKKELALWTDKSEGLSFASLAELVISVKCMGKGLEEMLGTLNAMQVKNVTTGSEETLGFDSI